MAAATWIGVSAAAEPGNASPAVRKDAAEAVQEGNVRQWIEYYERERLKARETLAPDAGSRQPHRPPATDTDARAADRRPQCSDAPVFGVPGASPAPAGCPSEAWVR